MLKIKIELWPFGDESKKRTLGELDIWNDATGTADFGNYGYRLNEEGSPFAAELDGIGEITDWNRRNPASLLVWKALDDFFSKEEN
jgi:hypothetical protein